MSGFVHILHLQTDRQSPAIVLLTPENAVIRILKYGSIKSTDARALLRLNDLVPSLRMGAYTKEWITDKWTKEKVRTRDVLGSKCQSG